MTYWSAPALLLFGVALGSHGLNVLSASALLLVDPVVAAALATIGALAGLTIDLRWSGIAAVIVAAAFAAAITRETSLAALPLLALGAGGVAACIAVAGWLLVEQTSSEREQQVFVVGSLLLLGGAAAYLSLPALVVGLLGGVVWKAMGNLARDRIVRDLRSLQHPLVASLLLVTGARITFERQPLSVAAVYVACAIAGEHLGRRLERTG